MYRYKLMSRLDARELSDVFLASKADGGGRACGKVLCKIYFQRFTTPEFARALAGAAQEAKKLNLPGLLSYDEVGFCRGHLLAIRNCIDGYAMDDVLHRLTSKEVVLTPQMAVWLTAEFARVAGRIHAAGAVHGALGPTNLLLGFDGSVAVSGLGMMRAVGASVPTRSVAFKLHRGCRAPEQRDPCSASSASDVYALGCLLYELLTMVPVSSVRSGGLSTKRDTLQPPSRLNRRINAHIDPIVMRALEQAPTRRYPDAGHFADALMALFPAIGACPSASDLSRFAHEVFPNEISLTGAQTGSSDWPLQEIFSLDQSEDIGAPAAPDAALPMGASPAGTSETAAEAPRSDDFSKLIFEDLEADFFDDIGAEPSSPAPGQVSGTINVSDSAPADEASRGATPVPQMPSSNAPQAVLGGQTQDDPFASWDAPPGELPKIIRRVSVVAANPLEAKQEEPASAPSLPALPEAVPEAGAAAEPAPSRPEVPDAPEPEPAEPDIVESLEPLVLSDDDIESLLDIEELPPAGASAAPSGEAHPGAPGDAASLPWTSAAKEPLETAVLSEAAAPVLPAGDEVPSGETGAAQTEMTAQTAESAVESSPIPAPIQEEASTSADASAVLPEAAETVPSPLAANADAGEGSSADGAANDGSAVPLTAADPAPGAEVQNGVRVSEPARSKAEGRESEAPAGPEETPQMSAAESVVSNLNLAVADMPSFGKAMRLSKSRPVTAVRAAPAALEAQSGVTAPPAAEAKPEVHSEVHEDAPAAKDVRAADPEWDDVPAAIPAAASASPEDPSAQADSSAGIDDALDSWEAPAGAMPKIVRRRSFSAPDAASETSQGGASGSPLALYSPGEENAGEAPKSITDVSMPAVGDVGAAVPSISAEAPEPAGTSPAPRRRPKRHHRARQEASTPAPQAAEPQEDDWHVQPLEPMEAEPGLRARYARKTVLWIVGIVVAAAAAICVVQAAFSAREKAATVDFAKDTASKIQSALGSGQQRTAYLSIQSDQPATVVINGQRFERDAPFEEAALPAGHIMVRLIHGGDVRLVELDLEPGKLTRASVSFEDAEFDALQENGAAQE